MEELRFRQIHMDFHTSEKINTICSEFDADDFASLIGTINYEPLCLIGRRVTRVYIKNNEVSNIQYMD